MSSFPGPQTSEQQLQDMTDFAVRQMEDSEASQFVQLRTTYEEILKVAAMHLSDKTSKEQLIKLLRICAFIGNDKITSRLVQLVKPKMNTLDN